MKNKEPRANTGKRRGARAATPERDPDLTPESLEALDHLRAGLVVGRPWPVVLLEALGMWTSPSEMFQGRRRQYLVENEAFDLMALAERLGQEVADLVPAPEWRQFSLRGRFPMEIAEEDLRTLLGTAKVKGLLNYWYGVALEGALQAAVRDEVRKERMGVGIRSQAGVADAAFMRIYGAMQGQLLQTFREQRSGFEVSSGDAAESKAFTYWLFKLRVNESEKTKVASDTRKALQWLRRRHPEPLLGLLPGLTLLEAEAGNGAGS